MRQGPKPAKSKEAKSPVGRKSPKNDGARARDLEKRLEEALKGKADALKREAEAQEQLQTRDRELAEAREQLTAAHAHVTESRAQQTASSAILHVISSSPTDIQAVFDTIVERAVRLCNAHLGALLRFDGQMIHLAAHAQQVDAESVQALETMFPMAANTAGVTGRALLWGRPVHVRDMREDPELAQAPTAQVGRRTVLSVPMMREGAPIGAITVARAHVEPFSDAQIELLKTFADQAVIAIENVRLFKELEARNRDLTTALDRQMATSEILRVISSSPTDIQPVFDAIVRSAVRLCDGLHGVLDRFDGELIHFAAQYNYTPEALQMTQRMYPRQPDRKQAAGRAILTGNVVNIADVQADPEYATDLAVAGGWRSVLNVPMLREGKPIGTIGVIRGRAGRFSDAQVELLKTFADQAVIAIENVRLFKELEARNRDLTEALEQQTATSEILGVISGSPTDVTPIFDTIAESAWRLCAATRAAVYRFEGGLVHFVAHHGYPAEALAVARGLSPAPPDRARAATRAIFDRTVVHIPDVFEDAEHRQPDLARAVGVRSLLAVPMLRDGEPLGSVVVGRGEPGPFSESQIALLQTFADQAVIAIENVRLFTELQEKNRALTEAHAQVTEALEQQTATAEVLKVISRSTFDLQPVLDTLIENATRLCEARRGVIMQREGDVYRGVAFYNVAPDLVEYVRNHPVTPGRHTITARAVLERRTIHVADIQADPEYTYARGADPIRTELGVPMVRGDDILGVIILYKLEVQPFTDKQIELVETFADQATIAIENVRLFTELQEKNKALTQAHAQVSEALEQQTATSDVLKVISRSTFDLMPVLETLTESATTLCGAQHGHIFQFDGEVLRYAVGYGTSSALRAYFSDHPVPLGPGSVSGTAAAERRTVHIHDVLADTGYQFGEAAKLEGWRTVLAVPMLRERALLGVIAIWKTNVEPFTDKQIGLVATFADQAVIAIENVRLLKELQARTSELARSVEELKALGEVSQAVSSTLNLDKVLTTIVARAVELSGAHGGVIYEYDDTTQELHVVRAAHRLDEDVAEVIRSAPLRLGEGVAGKAAALRIPVQVADVLDEQTYAVDRIRTLFERHGYRSALGVPLLFEQRILGVLTIWRQEAGTFTSEVVNLLQTFANQSVLAVENARLFREIENKSRQLEVASQHKSEFLANMSHELRTPLNAIIGFSEVLTDRMFGELNEKQEEYLKDIYASGTHLLSLINDILDLSKIEAGRMELELTEFDLPTALDNAIMLVRERAARHGISLHKSFDERLGQIQADERKVRQVVLNLLSNAIKFTPDGGRIEVLAAPKDGAVEVSVSDTGVGIAPEDQETVFEEFRQVGTAAKKVEGTGLGLTLCRKFVELHGGRIWVKSQPGLGSIFTFTIPSRRG